MIEKLSEEVEYLSNIVTPQGLKPITRNVDALREFPVPTNVKQLRQFLYLTSHYRRFVQELLSLFMVLLDWELHLIGQPFVNKL